MIPTPTFLVCRALLSIKSSKINVDALDEDGWTPLHAAVYWGNVDAAIMLVQAGASLNIATKLVRLFLLRAFSTLVLLCMCFPIAAGRDTQ